MTKFGVILMTAVTTIGSVISVVLVKRKRSKNSLVTAAGKIF